MANAKGWCPPHVGLSRVQAGSGHAGRQPTALAESVGGSQPLTTSFTAQFYHHHVRKPMTQRGGATLIAVAALVLGRRRGRCDNDRGNRCSKCMVFAVENGETGQDALSGSVSKRSSAVKEGTRTSGNDAAATSSGVPDSLLLEVEDDYTLLAKKRGFAILPFAREIYAWQRWPPSELVANAALTGLACILFAVDTLPAFNLKDTFLFDRDIVSALFAIDYLLRWYSRGLQPGYLLNAYMVFDAASIMPFLLRPFVPGLKETSLIFLRLVRTTRLYRLLKPRTVKELGRDFLGIDPDDNNVSAYQLQLARSFGVVFVLIFVVAGLMYTAEHEVNPQLSDFFSSFYFSIISLSTVGFGDIVPVTATGRLTLSVSILAALIIVPSEAGEVANAFAEEERAKTMQQFSRQAEKDKQIEKLISSLEEEKKRGNDTLADLQQLQNQRTSIKELRDLFNKYDADGSGEIGFAEFALMAEELGIV
mmetsp:Transcript_112619/g.223936  ORF Transcript_112619/g.223936 Transcript_112619/m.223936 type:complete len:478 (-) Transcript_112619:93-1526(-)